jgi:signal transduction histidine kinase
MKSMKSKIRTPFIVLIVIFPLVTLLLFNAAIRIYIEKNTRTELRAVVSIVETVVSKELPGNIRDFTENNLNRAFAKLYKALSASKTAVNVEMLLFNREQALIYPVEDTDGFADEQLINRISGQLPNMQDEEIYTVRIGIERYLVLPYPLTNSNVVQPTIVFVAHMTAATSMLRAINVILICITLLGAVVAAFIASRLSTHIARPVTELSDLTKEIGRGKFSLPKQSRGADEIIELNMLYQSISEMSLRLEAYDLTQKTFIQNASHELKTPLMSIQGYAEGIANEVLPDVKHAAEIIGNESMRLGTLVEELLTLSRIEGQTYTKELIPINLCDILKEYVQRMGGLASKQNKQLALVVPSSPLIVQADDTLLSQAVMNIASNCIRYAKTTSNIDLFHAESDAVIRITDDGNGIADSDLPHIFERFYKGAGGNFGLGLAIAKSAVEFMGGSIRAYNDSAGAIFEIRLPLIGN